MTLPTVAMTTHVWARSRRLPARKAGVGGVGRGLRDAPGCVACAADTVVLCVDVNIHMYSIQIAAYILTSKVMM